MDINMKLRRKSRLLLYHSYVRLVYRILNNRSDFESLHRQHRCKQKTLIKSLSYWLISDRCTIYRIQICARLLFQGYNVIIYVGTRASRTFAHRTLAHNSYFIDACQLNRPFSDFIFPYLCSRVYVLFGHIKCVVLFFSIFLFG